MLYLYSYLRPANSTHLVLLPVHLHSQVNAKWEYIVLEFAGWFVYTYTYLLRSCYLWNVQYQVLNYQFYS